MLDSSSLLGLWLTSGASLTENSEILNLTLGLVFSCDLF